MIVDLDKFIVLSNFIEEASRGLSSKKFYALKKRERNKYLKLHPHSFYSKKAEDRERKRNAKDSVKVSQLQKDANKNSGKEKTWVDLDKSDYKSRYSAEKVLNMLYNHICEIHFINKEGDEVTRYGTLLPVIVKRALKAREEYKKQHPPKERTPDQKAADIQKSKDNKTIFIGYYDVQKFKKDPANCYGSCRTSMITYCRVVRKEEIPKE